MNPRTIPSCNAAPPFVAAVEGQTPITGFPVEFQDLCSLAMDRALGIPKASLDKATRCEKASWYMPIPGKLFDVVTQAIASCMKLQMNWMILWVPRASLHVGKAESNSDSQAKPTAEVLERSMDIAIGQQHVAAPRSTAASSSDRKVQPQLQPTPDELAYFMDIAIGERFTVASSAVASTSDSQSPTAEMPKSRKAWQWLLGRTVYFSRYDSPGTRSRLAKMMLL